MTVAYSKRKFAFGRMSYGSLLKEHFWASQINCWLQFLQILSISISKESVCK